MIYITGDTHGNFKRFTKKRRLELPFELTAQDYVIVCGDFGLCWSDDAEFKYNCEWLGSLPFKILFVDGNHENHAMLAAYSIEEWNGGNIHQIVKDKVIHLMRGQIFHIDGNTIFTFGGASSHDVQGGILDKKDPMFVEKKKQAKRLKLPYRIKGYSWWEEELPNEEEMQEGLSNLAKADYQVDYVISHCGANSLQDKLRQHYIDLGVAIGEYDTDILTEYFEKLEDKIQYKQWFCGHYHVQNFVDEKHTVLYNSIVPITCYKN